jgi:crotonobetainyl-CoA:carnitine CoA-transferase CaiB-like acyl-CoA transferase
MDFELNSGERAWHDEIRSFPGQTPDGIQVLDLSRRGAGEFAARMLAVSGANVITVAQPDANPRSGAGGRGISGRHDVASQPEVTGDHGITADLRDPADRESLLRLADTASAVVESFGPGHLERVGLAPEVLRGRNPRLVVTRISAFGQHGPYRDYEATGLVLQALSGVMRASGDTTRPPLRRLDLFEDQAVGRAAAEATLAGIYSAQRTGTGAEINVSGHEVLLSGAGTVMEDTAGHVPGPRPPGSASSHLAGSHTADSYTADPHTDGSSLAQSHLADSHLVQDVYPAAGDIRWVAISLRHDRDWEALTQTLIAAHVTVRGGREWPADFAAARRAIRQSAAGQSVAAHAVADAAAIRARIAAWTRARDAADIVATLQTAGVPAGQVLTQAQARAQPHSRARGWFQEAGR